MGQGCRVGGCNAQAAACYQCWPAPHGRLLPASATASLPRRYTALLYRPTNLTAPIFSLALTATGTATSGITSFTEDVALPAGPYRLEIATSNVHGDGGKAGPTGDFTVGEAPRTPAAGGWCSCCPHQPSASAAARQATARHWCSRCVGQGCLS